MAEQTFRGELAGHELTSPLVPARELEHKIKPCGRGLCEMVSQALLHIFPALGLAEHAVTTVQPKQTFANYTQLVIFCGINLGKAKWELDLTHYL